MHIFNILFISLFLTACASPVNIDYDKNINFNSYTYYSINNQPVRTSTDTRINSPFMQQRVVDELKFRFDEKGYKYSNSQSDITIKYYLDVKHEIETIDSGRIAIGFGSISHHSSVGIGLNLPIGEAASIDSLVLTIDIYSTKTNKLLWRGSLGSYLYEGATPETHSNLVNRLVGAILEKFPPN